MNHSAMKLGRKAMVTDSRTVRMARYMTDALPAPPVAVDWTRGITDWGMMLNDQLGCCTIAGVAHAVQVWTANLGAEVTVSDDQVLAFYEQWDGYDPSDPSTDQGGVELDVLKRWKAQGFAGGHKLMAFADPSVSNLDEIRQAINLFGGVYIGLDLPLSAQSQDVWDVAPGSDGFKGSWGGHCVFVPKYDADGFTCITWGQIKMMTNAFWLAYCDEAHALLDTDWILSDKSPAGFDVGQLLDDLTHIAG